ncbi:MAG: hypothetical protein AABX34_02940 [Nanoarchaeota archaeon]
MDSPLKYALDFYTTLRSAGLSPSSMQSAVNSSGMDHLEKSVLLTLNQKEMERGKVISGQNSMPPEPKSLDRDCVWSYGLTGLAGYEAQKYTDKDLRLN